VPHDDDILDPRGAFRWVEAGVSGLARQREWDATAIVEVPALRASDATEVDFRVLGDGSVIGDVDREVLAQLTNRLDIEAPYAARAVRQDEIEWIVGAIRFESDLIELPAGVEALALEAAVPPDGEAMYIVDGDMLAEPPDGPVADALAELERIGASRFQAFVARADRLEDGRWELTVDAL
jgi:hypothetical protein